MMRRNANAPGGDRGAAGDDSCVATNNARYIAAIPESRNYLRKVRCSNAERLRLRQRLPYGIWIERDAVGQIRS